MSPELSLVIPIRNESPNIDALYVEMTEALERWGRSYEVLAIDDGSTDDSFDRLVRCQQRDPRWRIIRFRRNFGQTAAFSAGFRHARGRSSRLPTATCRTIPAILPDMIRRIEEGSDIVCGWRKDRKDPWLTRRLPSELANKLISWSTGVKLHDYGCSLKVFRAEVVKPLKLYGEMHRFLPAIASEMGVTIDEVVVNHRAQDARRVEVRVVENLSRGARSADGQVPAQLLDAPAADVRAHRRADGRSRVSRSPRICHTSGSSATSRLRIVLCCCSAVLLIFSGIQLVTMGLLAEIMARTYHESQDKPIYVIRDVCESPQPEPLPHSLSV